MESIPSTLIQKQEPTIGQLKQQVAILQAENERVKSAYNQVSAENQKLKQQFDWEKWLFSNPAYSPSEKLTIWATKPIYLKSTPNEQGLCHIPLYQIAPAIGMDRKTVGRNFIKLSETTTDVKRDAACSETELGTWNTDVSITFSEQLLSRPDTTTRLEPRNQGGKRKKRCQNCGSENLVEQKTVACDDCGCVQSKTHRHVNPLTSVQIDQEPTKGQVVPREEIQKDGILDHAHTSPDIMPADTVTEDFEVKASIPLPPQKPTTPPAAQSVEGEPRDNLSPVLKPEKPRANLSFGEIPLPSLKPTTPPVGLFLDIVGDAPDHIVMNTNPRVTKKYLTVHSPLTETDIQMHLLGTKTVGASLVYADETTRALCFDADTEEDWQKLQEAAKELQTAGYSPFLERSPKRGGHLWIIFESRVHAKSAYTRVCTIAPVLKECEEYWPRGNGYKVRLPAGKYVTPTFAEWCHVQDVSGVELSNMPLTPANLIPDEEVLEEDEAPHRSVEQSAPFSEPLIEASLQTNGVDDYHRRKYRNAHLWFAWTPAQLAEWYQSRTTITELLPPERNGNGLASWRGERTASVAYTQDGEGWVDFGASARRPDGKQDGGDCLELLARMQQRSKSEVMSDLGKILVREAKEALISAAHTGTLPPQEVQNIMTEDGWKYYHKLCKSNICSAQVGHDDQNTAREDEEEQPDGGVAGFGEAAGQDEAKEVIEDQPSITAFRVKISESSEPIPNEEQASPPLNQPQAVYWWQKSAQLADKIPDTFFTVDPPCETCGCPFYRQMAEYQVCVRCYPPRGYHLYQHLIDARYPRGKRSQ